MDLSVVCATAAHALLLRSRAVARVSHVACRHSATRRLGGRTMSDTTQRKRKLDLDGSDFKSKSRYCWLECMSRAIML